MVSKKTHAHNCTASCLVRALHAPCFLNVGQGVFLSRLPVYGGSAAVSAAANGQDGRVVTHLHKAARCISISVLHTQQQASAWKRADCFAGMLPVGCCCHAAYGCAVCL